ncbi:WD40-repeat-containing domain protein [Aspergillus pseudonomiae]|uniref:WD40-repeat-containing domain protein n=1 Tax=Aspergillus pseudonomiae TaxID=1506151 RepID=A0A5N7CVE5_9EURO|nr:WD40-repeat-containing domain protein [Aspergillus pseudonomiae]KAE8397563.1 WD40-repeat-containing domain protein [Aspergillus pseudonomiae]
MALRSLPFTFSSQIMPRVFTASQAMSSVRGRCSHIWQTSAQTTPNISATLLKPGALALNIPGFLSDIWDSVLRAVPKKKTSHMKKRHRQMAGKALKDVKSLNTCPGCGQIKRAHVLCPHCVETHPTDIFSLAVTNKQILSASGVSALKVHSTAHSDFPLVQSIDEAHKLGCHHVVTDGNGSRSVSVGFGGEIKIWSCHDGTWSENKTASAGNAGSTDIWAIALSDDGQYLAGVSQDGHIRVWDLDAGGKQIRDYETKGSFGTCIDLSADGRLIASGHENGSIYIFSTETGRMPFSLSGLVKPVRAVAFSPGGKFLAAAGDSNVIVLYDTSSGEQVANLSGHSAWVLSLSWSHTGEYLLSGSFDGKVKVWSIDTRTCVATHSETERAVWNVKWLPKIGKSEGFATAGASRSISFYREATGG